MRPYTLPPNILRHFYAGGERIAALRGTEPADHTPEEWIGAVNTTFDGSRGPSRLPDGTLVRDAVAADPEAFLGPAHVARYGADPALLVKLLDAGQRLPVHFHPGREFAARELGLAHGKTEAWLIVEADAGAAVHVGFSREVGLDEVRGWMAAQDSAAMLGAMQELPVAAGDAIFVPAGVPHAIGAGILMVELQEPTDFSILLEHDTFGVTDEAGATLGLGWDKAIQALDRRATDAPERTLPAAAAAYFRAEHPQAPATLDQGFSILVVTGGSGQVGGMDVARGDTVLVPHAAGDVELSGDVTAIRCRPPAPDAPEGEW
jgi:mannose-6-phosphate isomerase